MAAERDKQDQPNSHFTKCHFLVLDVMSLDETLLDVMSLD